MPSVTYDIVFAGVGGQGVLSLATILAEGAQAEGFRVKQSEIHGMSQRGGAVSASLRISDQPIRSPLVTRGTADLLLSLEPLETFRYLEFLKPAGRPISSTNPFENIPDYPPMDEVMCALNRLPNASVLDLEALARQAGNVRTTNVVMVGAASQFFPITPATLETEIRHRFEAKGERVIAQNLKAFHLGRAALQPAVREIEDGGGA